MPSALTAVDIVVALLGVYLVRAIIARRSSRLPHPPGPKGLPIIGNVADMPKSHEWHKFSEWGEKYGDIIYLNLLGQPMVVLNSAQHAIALLDKRSTLYSDRPKLMMGGEIVGWKYTLALTPYGQRFREYRRFIARLIGGPAQMHAHLPLEEHETKRFLRRLLRDPARVAEHIRKTAGCIILKLSHGYEVAEGHDPVVHLVDTATEQFSLASSPGAFLVDVFPLLRYVPAWLPGAGFQTKAREWKQVLDTMADVPHEFVKRRMAEHTNIPNYTSELLQNEKLEGDKEFNIKWSAASLYSGGADTTVSAVYSFFLAMTLFPEAAKRAHAEIDSVVGTDRLPTFADRPHLPYVEALMKEVFRWNPVVPLGVPHRLLEDDVYEGYLIPKGSIVISNIWNILHDPSLYANPFVFDPTRFLPEDGRAPETDPREYCFGFGRRICPGLHLADSSVYISCAMVLATFDISKSVENGEVVEPVVEYTSGTISHPKPFKCTIKPRSAKAEALILSDDE
ncbi:cytochrome P450 [Phanerochaete sordida]|uniref:Cytochrome P450 n=1 Tax=Phanerochaete sordida TaxID=48140 RepID=A0A9P3G1S4_9APHY|nr:cytochrome P450 [Phanerochaete sordida]